MAYITALGELLIDFTPAGLSQNNNRLFEQNPGGAPANVLTAVVKQGGIHVAVFVALIGFNCKRHK